MVPKRLIPALLILFAALGGVACDSTSASDDVNLIRTTTSFGFCIGYCRATLEVTADGIVFLEEGTRQPGLPPVRRTAPITPSEWRALTEGVDQDDIESLPDTIGCPDCADGGAESVEVIATDWRKEVTFEFDAEVRELQPLLGRLRALRARFPPTVAPN
jgi:hypothetical protein